ncbi:galactosyltransferase [Campylobacter insulaenigrae]|uniref:glycosyltransferase family 2 protein n=1 Tax=Campylobacter insulaenigrae TaxID=260714 RepID=UPI000F70F435|nr:glycosyltransferase family 2 protein [Campylobacter insulaenigrae]MCR6591248.1 glycosyltransferase family 2 protein [Campylobacter insulaenigrae]MCR6592856.1 glycosyltransferase family 2 protein [Campylobacter insulaenigrae]VEJ52649.1 galactosyltransferase [Campylobacter insulaenigrae]
MDNKRVGIIIPVYNVERYITQCLEGIKAQTYQNYIVVMVDDESTDNSVSIAREYTKYDKRFNIIHKKNGGLSSALNAGIEYFTNSNHEIDYVIFLDSDDFWNAECLEICVYKMNNVQIVWFDYEYIFDGIPEYTNKYTRLNYLQYNNYEQIITPMDFFKRVFLTQEWHAFAKMGMIDFKFLLKTKMKFMKGLFLEDHLFGVLLFAQSSKIRILPRKLYNYRIRKQSLCNYDNSNHSYMPSYFQNKYKFDFEDKKKYDELSSKFIIALGMLNFIKRNKNKKINYLIQHSLIKNYLNSAIDLVTCSKDPSNILPKLIKMSKHNNALLIKKSVEYKLGGLLKSIKTLVKGFMYLKSIKMSDYSSTLNELQDPKSLMIKNHFSYILGSLSIKIYRKNYFYFILLYPFIVIYSYYLFKSKKKLKINIQDHKSEENNIFIDFHLLKDNIKYIIAHNINSNIILNINIRNTEILDFFVQYNKAKIYHYEYNPFFYFYISSRYSKNSNLFMDGKLIFGKNTCFDSIDYSCNDNGNGFLMDYDVEYNAVQRLSLNDLFAKFDRICILNIYLDFYNYKDLNEIMKYHYKIGLVVCFVDYFFQMSNEFKKIYKEMNAKTIIFVKDI